jgi:HSP20 family protein
MAIARWDPFREMSRMQEEFNRLFDDSLFRWRRPPRQGEEELRVGFSPPVDIYEDKDQVALTAEIPGIDPKDIEIQIENGVLTVRGERKLEREENKEGYLRMERNYGTFLRSFSLPTTVDGDRAKAEFKNGLLRVTLPKKEEAKARSVKVKVEPGS